MKAKCVNGCFEREVPLHLEKEIKKNERFHICTTCGGRVLVIE
jgi:hypothetical protein